MLNGAAQPSGLLAGFHAGLSKLEDKLTLLSAIAIFFLMFVAVAQILARNVFGTAIHGYIDYIEQSSAIFAFLGIAYCQRQGAHVRMDVLLRLLSRRGIWALEAFGTFAALVIIGLLIRSSFDNFLTAFRLGDSTMDIRLPIWPTKLMVPVALAILWLRLLVQWLGYMRLVIHPLAVPVAVAALETVHEQASAEIEDTVGSYDKEKAEMRHGAR